MPLVLDSLEIKNFRAFKHLRIEKLGRVNLIVGKNNVGKSSVLEALRLFAYKGDPYVVFSLLRERNELSVAQNKHFRRDDTDIRKIILSLRHLFHGWHSLEIQPEPLIVRSLQGQYLAISLHWPASNMYISKDNDQPVLDDEPYLPDKLAPRLEVRTGDAIVVQFPLNGNYSRRSVQSYLEAATIHSMFVSSTGLDLDEAGSLWDNVALSDLEGDVLSAIQLIAPQIKAINFFGTDGPNGERTPRIRLPETTTSLPLSSMGEGMNRMLGIALALVNAKDGMLLIDEVDTGLHYSVLPDLWKLIFEVAHRLNVQVFATSHSWDCIEAFQLAAANNENEEGVLIRLEERKAGVAAVVFDERDLAIVTREQIEVR